MTIKHILAIWQKIPVCPETMSVNQTVCGSPGSLWYGLKDENTLHVFGTGGKGGE